MQLLLVYQILVLKVQVNTVDGGGTLPVVLRSDSLTIESGKLWLVLNEVILAILKHSLIVKASNTNHSLTLWLCIFICILHLLFSLLHVTRSYRLNLAM